MAKKGDKAGTSRIEAKRRRKMFVKFYLTNGRNATQAAISAGFAEKGAPVTGNRLLKEAYVREMLDADIKHYEEITGLNAERTLREVARIAYFDPRRTLDAAGQPLPLDQLPDDVAAVVAEEKITHGDGAPVTTLVRKFVDKKGALDMAMRHHGLYEKDNQQREPVKVTVELVG